MALHYWENSRSGAHVYEFSVHMHSHETVAFHDPENDWQFDEWRQGALHTMFQIKHLLVSSSKYLTKET